MPARGLTRKITRKQARSYEISSPNTRARRNGMGVTAIASVNARASGLKAARLALMKKRRAAELRNIAAGRRPGAPYAKPTRAAARAELRRRGLSTKNPEYADRYTRTRTMLNAGGGQMRSSMMNRTRRRARRNYSAREMEDLYESQMAAARGGGGATRSRGKRRLTKKEKARRAKASAARRKAASRKVGKRYGKFRSLPARVGGRRASTYLYKSKRGAPKKIPLWAILGAKSKKDFERRQGEPRFARRIVAAKRRRDRKAARLQAHGDAFTPNRRSAMKRRARRNTRKGKMRGAALAKHRAAIKRGKRRAAAGGAKRTRRSAAKRKTGGGRKRRTAKQRAATLRMIRARHPGKRIRRRRAWKNKATVAIPNRRRRRRARRNQPIMQAAANRRRRRRSRRNPVITQAAANRRRRRRKARRNPIMQAAANRRRRRRRSRRNPLTQAAANPRRRRRRRARRNGGMMYANKRRRSSRRRARRNPMYANRRRARRNGDIIGQITDVLKVGAAVLVGFVAHRGLTWVVSEKLLPKLEVFNTGALAEYRGLIGGAVVVIGGIAGLAKFAPSQIAKAGVGMGVSFLHGALVFALKKIGQPEVAGYFAAYPDAEGVAFHTMAGYGSYETLPPGYSGMGEYDYYNQYSGMGQLTQAAAGVGEYFAPGVNGVGEYEAVDGMGGSGFGYTDEGIHPNLHSAEQALSVAEAAAGVGDLPLTSTVNPYQIAAPIQDAPGGSRAGILQGPEGIFG